MSDLQKYEVALDVFYQEDHATVGFVLFEDHNSAQAFKTGHIHCQKVAPYISGQFYRRELPCLLQALSVIQDPIKLIYVDANVWLDHGKMGMGKYLYDALEGQVPVIGISKSCFKEDTDVIRAVKRPSSKHPLYVSSVGIHLDDACEKVRSMHGAYRLPAMIKLADQICRETASSIVQS